MRIGGLDIGTSGCKVVLFDETGTAVQSAYREYDVNRRNGLHEIDAEAVWESVKTVLKETACEEIGAIAVTSFGETFVMLDENDRPVGPSMLYTDPRGEAECAFLTERLGAESMAYRTGTNPHQMYSLPKIMWIKQNLPQEFCRVKRILLMQDFVVYKLCGSAQIDYSLASRTLCFDIEKKCWDKDILNCAGVDGRLLSTPVPSGTAAGTVRAELAEELGLSKKLCIVTGCHDQIAAMTGAAVFEEEAAMDGTGTVECVPVVMDAVPKNYELYQLGYAAAPHINGKFACYALSYAGGATLKWFRDNFSQMPYDEMDKQVPAGPSGLLILPHFAGAATPYMDINAKAAVIGLTFEHTKFDFYKALMEGTAFEILLNLETLKRFAIAPKELVATGGGARSDVWLQIKADILGLPVTALQGEEIGAAGTAYLAGKTLGLFSGGMAPVKRKTFYPNAENHTQYLKQFETYRKLYSSIKNLNERGQET